MQANPKQKIAQMFCSFDDVEDETSQRERNYIKPFTPLIWQQNHQINNKAKTCSLLDCSVFCQLIISSQVFCDVEWLHVSWKSNDFSFCFSQFISSFWRILNQRMNKLTLEEVIRKHVSSVNIMIYSFHLHEVHKPNKSASECESQRAQSWTTHTGHDTRNIH